MNWKSVVEKKNAEIFKLPAGWDSRDTVAEELECSPERVSEILRPAIKAKDVEQSTFPVWDKELKRVIRVTAYRQRAKVEAKKS